MFNIRTWFNKDDEEKKQYEETDTSNTNNKNKLWDNKNNLWDIVLNTAGAIGQKLGSPSTTANKDDVELTTEYGEASPGNVPNIIPETEVTKDEAPNSNNTTMADYETLYNELMNREPFQYDVNGDALYQQYKDNYIQQGKMAMEDAMGQMSSLTGGYASSAAMSAGQQAYQGELSKINEVVPDLYQNALNKYLMEGEDLANKYAVAYGQHRDKVSDQQTNAVNFYESGGKVGYDNGSLSPEQVTELTTALGLNTNGQWNGTALDATGMTADEAWAHYQDALSRGESFYYSTVANDIDTFIELGSMTRRELYDYLDKAQKEGLITIDEAAALHEVVEDKVDKDFVPGVGEDSKKLKEEIAKTLEHTPVEYEDQVIEAMIDNAYKAGEITETEREYLLEYFDQ